MRMIVDVKLPLSRFAAALFSASLRERWIASDELSDNDIGSGCPGDGMPIVALNGWQILRVDGGPRRKHKVPPRTECPRPAIVEYIVFGPPGRPIVGT